MNQFVTDNYADIFYVILIYVHFYLHVFLVNVSLFFIVMNIFHFTPLTLSKYFGGIGVIVKFSKLNQLDCSCRYKNVRDQCT